MAKFFAWGFPICAPIVFSGSLAYFEVWSWASAAFFLAAVAHLNGAVAFLRTDGRV
jgi:hypothetical protein